MKKLFFSIALSSLIGVSVAIEPKEQIEQEANSITLQQFQWPQTSQFSSLFSSQKKIALNPKEKYSTNAVLIIKDNTIVFEEYYNGFTSEQKQRLWSISKSFSGALYGIALKKKLLKLSSPVSLYYPKLRGRIEKTITLEHLLSMSSGLKWSEGYEKNPFNSHVINMLYLESQSDMATYTSMQKSTYRPGSVFKYSSGDSNLAMGVFKKIIQPKERHDNFAWTELFEPLGITDATWEQDSSGTFVGSSYLFLSARNLARFAKLILDKGQWLGTSLIDKDFVKKSLTPSHASCTTKSPMLKKDYSYGLYWWLNSSCPQVPKRKAFKNLPSTVALALGHHGQIMAIFPEQNAIAIRLGADKEGALDREVWLDAVFSALQKIPTLNVNATKEAL